MKFVFKLLVTIILIFSFLTCAMAARKIKNLEEFKHCKAACYKQHKECLAICNKQREQHKKSGKHFNYNNCRYNLENKKCMPQLNNCVMTKCHPNFRA